MFLCITSSLLDAILCCKTSFDTEATVENRSHIKLIKKVANTNVMLLSLKAENQMQNQIDNEV